MILLPTNRRIIRPGDKPSFEHTQRYGLIKGHWANVGRIALWPFNKGSGGQVFDLSGNGLTGTFNGDIIWSPGKFGPAPDFPGVTNYITAPLPSNFSSLTTITFLFWVKSDIGNAGLGQGVFRIRDTRLNTAYGKVKWTPDVDVGGEIDESYTIAAGEWYQIAVTQTGTDACLYINGVLIGSGTVAALDLVSSFDVNLGNYNGAGGVEDLDGQIDIFSIYGRVLSASEVAQLTWNPFIGIEKRTAPVYFFVPTGGVVKELAGTSAISSTTAGVLKATRELVGTSAIGSTTSGILGKIVPFAGTTAIGSTTAGELSKAAEKILTGTTAISSTTSGVIKTTREILGTVAISSTVTGDLVSPTRAFAGTVTIASATSGDLSKAAVKELTGTSAISSTTSGNIKLTQELIGTVAIESITTGELTKTGIKEIAGTTVISSATSGDLSVPRGGFSDYAENSVLELITGKTPFTKPTVYVGFCTADPGEEATGANCNEVADTNGYERIAADDWNSASSGAIDNAAAFATPCATGSWGEITHYVLVDSLTHGEGNVLVYDKLDVARVIDERDNLEFAVGELCLTLD